MITLQLLEPHDTIRPTDWMRPLHLVTMSGGHSDHYSFRNTYGGTPENHVQWVQVRDLLGECWDGKTVREFASAMDKDSERDELYFDSCKYEFVRGDVPKSHQLDMAAGRYHGVRDELDFDHKSFNEWSEAGYCVKKGEKSRKTNRWGDKLFHRSQVTATRGW